MDKIKQLIKDCLNIPIVNILHFYKYPLKGYFPRLTTIAKWRNGRKYNVSIYLETNTFYDFVSGDFGNVLNLHSLITGEDLKSINYLEFFNKYSNISLSKNIENIILENEYFIEEQNSDEIIDEINNIYNNSKNVFKDHYFNKKNIIQFNDNIKQIKISNFVLNNINKKHIRLTNHEKYLLKLKNAIVIPMYNIETFKLQSIQYILPNIENETNKLFHVGGKLKFSIYPINYQLNEIKEKETFILCEGVCTGLSIKKVTDHLKIDFPILSCFNSSNIQNVCDFLLQMKKKVIIASDYDQLNINNKKLTLGAGIKTIKKYNNNINVICSIANINNNDSKFFLNDIYDEFVSENKFFENKITDFNDIEVYKDIDYASQIFVSSLNYYCHLFNKNNFCIQNYTIKTDNTINSPFSYRNSNKLNEINDIIIENKFVFYN